MKKRLAIGLTLLVVALSSLVWIIPTFAANTHVQHTAARQPQSIFALEHQVGKPVAGAKSAFKFSCTGATTGNLLINVTEKVSNDADSGQGGNYWGLDAFTRTISVWNTGADDSYCAIVSYKGTFAAAAGQESPGTVGTLTGDEVGTMNGSAQFLITLPLKVSDPANWPLTGNITHGNIVNYQCTLAGVCPGYVDWIAKYFDEPAAYNANEPNWGWTYVGKDKKGSPDAGKSDGTWVNALSGNSGDILDVDA